MKQPVLLIVGGGIAGISAALKCASFAQVHVLYKTRKLSSASSRAQGGIAAVQTQEDSVDQHVRDTLEAGYGLCHKDIVEKCVRLGPARLKELKNYGVHFDADLHREGGHVLHRIAHVGDHTGRSIMDCLIERAEEHPNIYLHEHQVAVDLIVNSEQRVLGLYVLNRYTGEIVAWPASQVILATGGAGKVYLYSSNPPEASGDGIAIALRAGCRVANMEFFQFHPTLFHHPRLNSFLITEALRGAGAKLINDQGNQFTDELLPRDQVARAIDLEMKRSGARFVRLDCTGMKNLAQRFPQVVSTVRTCGIDPEVHPIPVVPGAHYCCGGVVVDECGRTGVDGLYTIGEIASTGLHGANRLASNSLLEALVFAHECAEKIGDTIEAPLTKQLPPWDFGQASPLQEEVLISHYWDEIRRCMWNFVGIVRSHERLQKAKNRLAMLETEIHELYWTKRPSVSLLELRNLCLVSQAIIENAFQRRESRGLHFMQDFPETKKEFAAELYCDLSAFGRRQWKWAALPAPSST